MVKKYIVTVKYSELEKPAMFASDIDGLKVNDKVLVNTERGTEVGTIVSEPTNIESFPTNVSLSPIVGRPTDTELHIYEDNITRAKESLKIAEREAKELKLDMNFLLAEYVLDASKIIITYTAEGRIDFRELLKVLASKLHTRIEFKQIGSRDKARATGGVGPCGREICCVKFLKTFDGISINRAKNQQLALNNAKLSGSCGKLMCCLMFEDETYTKENKNFPPIGSIIKINDQQYKVLGFNIISKSVKCSGPEGISFIPLEEIKKHG